MTQLRTLRTLFKERLFTTTFILFSAGMGIALSLLTNIPLIRGNFGDIYANTTLALIVLIAVLFGMNIAALVYKIKESAKIQTSTATSTTIGSFLAILVAGCSVCGVTIASFLGLTALVSLLPYHGLELKLLSVVLLLYSTHSLLKPTQCTLHKKQKNRHSQKSE